MKKVRIEFDTVNAAFEAPGEVDRILLQARDKIQQHQMGGGRSKREEVPLRDLNGNTVGKVIIT